MEKKKEFSQLEESLRETREKINNYFDNKVTELEEHKFLVGLAHFLKLDGKLYRRRIRKLEEKNQEQRKIINSSFFNTAKYLASEQKSPELRRRYEEMYYKLLRLGVAYSQLKNKKYGRLRQLRLNYLNKKRIKRGKSKLKLRVNKKDKFKLKL